MFTRRSVIGGAGLATLAAQPAALAAAFSAPPLATAPQRPAGEERPLALTYISTVSHFDSRVAGTLRPGQPLTLQVDRERRYGGDAVRAEAGTGLPVGYLPQIHSEMIAAMLDAGLTLAARVHAVSGPRSRPTVPVRVALVTADAPSGCG